MAEGFFLTCGFCFWEHSTLTFASVCSFWKDENFDLLVASCEVDNSSFLMSVSAAGSYAGKEAWFFSGVLFWQG